MSGGHFNYDQYRIGQIADDIEGIINHNDSEEKNIYGQDLSYQFSPETLHQFKEAILALRKAEIFAQRIDWLLSGDDGEESFHKRLEHDLAILAIPSQSPPSAERK